jgi:hypothetical protein
MPKLKTPSLKTLCTVRLGTITSVQAFEEELAMAGRNIDKWARDIMSKTGFVIEPVESDLEIVKVAGAIFGFTGAAPRSKIFKLALDPRFGLRKLPPEAFLLAVLAAEQKNGECWLAGMDAIKDSDDLPDRFYAERRDDGETCLGTFFDVPGHLFDPDDIWLFGRIQKR